MEGARKRGTSIPFQFQFHIWPV